MRTSINPTYTHGHSEAVLRSHRWRTAKNSAGYLLDALEPGQRLLDVGAGPATLTADLAQLVHPGQVCVVEIDEATLAVAREGLLTRGVQATVGIGDVHDLPYPDGSFDVVHAHQVLQHVADPVRALSEMRRVARPGAVVAARDCDYAAMVWSPQSPELDRWLAAYREVARADGGEPDAGRRLLGWAQRAGLTDVVATSATWCFSTPQDRLWWASMWADRMRSTRVGTRAIELGLLGGADIERIGEAWLEWANAEDGWFSVLHGEILCRV